MPRMAAIRHIGCYSPLHRRCKDLEPVWRLEEFKTRSCAVNGTWEPDAPGGDGRQQQRGLDGDNHDFP